MRCDSCSQFNRAEAQFCATCGSTLRVTDAKATSVSQGFPGNESSRANSTPPRWLPELALGLMAISAGVLAFIWRPDWAGYFATFRYAPGYMFSSLSVVSLFVSLAIVILLLATGTPILLRKPLNPVFVYAAAGAMTLGALFVSLSFVTNVYWLSMWEPLSNADGRLGRIVFGLIGTASAVGLAAVTLNPQLVGSTPGSPTGVQRVPGAPRVLPAGMAPCSMGNRIGAVAIDGAIRGAVSTFFYFAIIVAVVGSLSSESSAPMLIVPLAALVFLIPPWNTIWRQGNTGQSVGKGATRLMIVRNDGSKVNKATIFGRAVLASFAGFFTLGIFTIVDIIMTWTDPIHQRLIDRLLGLHVVNADSVPQARGFITPNIARPYPANVDY
jgi:uncharacterized RDD family membrane protein YckC